MANKREILGNSPAVKQMLDMIRRVASSKVNVLIIGESGTGKELVARMIHESGPLDGTPFIPVNCGAIPENLIESEMFGHKKGSFTGAIADKPGLFEAAHGGTLFLDEVGELPVAMQVKLLRAIQERVFRRVGANEDMKVDVRIIAATNRDLEAAVAKGTFREDLYYRLNVIQLKTPPLRERKGDVGLLMDRFLERFAKRMGKAIQAFSPEARSALESYPWPGNVRELENIVERAITLENSPFISLESLPEMIQPYARNGSREPGPPSSGAGAAAIRAADDGLRIPAADFSKGPLDLEKILGEVEKTYLLAALDAAGGIKKKASSLLGITFRSMRYRLKKLGVDTGPDSEGEE